MDKEKEENNLFNCAIALAIELKKLNKDKYTHLLINLMGKAN